jgi:hypothetical protein
MNDSGLASWIALSILAALAGTAACAMRPAVDRTDAGEHSDAGERSEGGAGSGEETGGAGGSGAGGASGNGTSGASGAGATDGASIWTPSSDAIELEYQEFFGGWMHYQKSRNDLTGRELDLIGAIRTVESAGPCGADGGAIRVTVTTGDNRVTYSAGTGGYACSAVPPFVNFGDAMQLLTTAGCNSQSDAASSLDDARMIDASSGCYHRMYVGTQSDWWFLVEVTDPGPLRVLFDSCAYLEPATATVLVSDGESELAHASAEAGSCPDLTVDIHEAGTYALHVAVEAASPAAFEFHLHFERGD